MVRVKDVYEFIDSFAPYSTQNEFDNSGYMTGDKNAEVKKILVSLDLTGDVLREAEENGVDLIVNHHPILFDAPKSIMSESLIYSVIKSGISVISAHTNLDIADGGVNTALFASLGVNEYKTHETDPFLKIAEIEPVYSDELIKKVASSLNTVVRHNGVKKTVKTLSICSGSGSQELYVAIDEGVDAFLTGEAKYHTFIDADTNGILLMAAGHYETENVVVPVLAEKLRKQFPDIEIIESNEKNPVNYYTK